MKYKTLSKKAHQLGSVLIVLLFIISIFSFGFYTENNSGLDNNKNIESKITGAVAGMGRVTGMAEATPEPALAAAQTTEKSLLRLQQEEIVRRGCGVGS